MNPGHLTRIRPLHLSGLALPHRAATLENPKGGGMANYIGAIDQGTTSTRFLIFDRAGRIAASAQKEHEQIYPQPGWVEHDPEEIWLRTHEVIAEAMVQGDLRPGDLAALGITNQRETTVLWDRTTGRPLYNALVWQDTRVDEDIPELARDGGADRFRSKTGLPLATYFSALKIRWLLDRVPGARRWLKRARRCSAISTPSCCGG